jgi:lysophospholipase L1-like esterase
MSGAESAQERLPVGEWPLDRPLSVVVVGNSLTFDQVPARTTHLEGTYGEVLRDELAALGQPVALHLEGRWFEFVSSGLRRYEQSVRAHVPDVVIVQYGLNESQPYLFPICGLRHFITDHKSACRFTLGYRRHVVTPVWRRVRAMRRFLSPIVGTRTWQMTPERFRGKMSSLIGKTRREFRPLVLVMDVAPPGPLLEHFLPGQEERHRIYQQVLEELVDGFGDRDVRLVRTEPVVRALGFEAALPDGMHFSVLGHRMVGELLTAEVLDWLGQRSDENAIAADLLLRQTR